MHTQVITTGTIGPPGPPGEQGPQGDPGATGPQGPPGLTEDNVFVAIDDDLVALTAQGYSPAQTADLFQAKSSAGAILASMSSAGHIGAGTQAVSTASLIAQPESAGIIGGIVKGFSGQTADFQQYQSSTGTVLSKIGPQGRFSFGLGSGISAAGPIHTYVASGVGPHIIVLDGDNGSGSPLFATTKFNSQGVAWNTITASDPNIILQSSASGRPEISWYRGVRTYPQFSIRESTTADVGGELWAGAGIGAPTLAMIIGSTQISMFSTNTMQVDSSGRASLKTGINTSMMFMVGSGNTGASASTSQYGISVDVGAPVNATGLTAGYHGRWRTAASGPNPVTSAYVFVADTPSVGASTSITSAYGVRVFNQGAAGVSNVYGIAVDAQSGAASVNYAMQLGGGSTGLVVSGDGKSMTIGGTSGLTVDFLTLNGTHSSTAASVYGFASQFNSPATATSNHAQFWARVGTVAASFTQGSAYGFQLAAPSIGAGSTISNLYGINIANQGAAGVTNAYGLWIAAQSGAGTNNLPLVVAGTSIFTVDSVGRMGVGTSSNTDRMIYILAGQAHPSTATTVYGIGIDYVTPVTATSGSEGIRVALRTAASAFTVGSVFGVRVVSPNVGAGSTVSNMYGFYASNQGLSGVTNAYGAFISAQSGAATLNVGVRIETSTTAALWLGGDAAGTTVSGGITFGSGRDVSIFRIGALELSVNDSLRILAVASQVNTWRIVGAAIGGGIALTAQGSDTDVYANINSKGAGALRFNWNSGTGGVIFSNGSAATQFAIGSDGIPQWAIAGNAQTTVGAAGAASALPATPTKYLKVKDSAGTTLVIPAYAAT